MPLSVLTRKALWGRAGNRCAFPQCRRELNQQSGNLAEGVVIGEEAHIVAREEEGPRGKSPLTTDERDRYENLILLCSPDHKIIDTDVAAHPVESLHKLKEEHEAWVRATLDTSDQAIMEQYAEILERWTELARLNRWEDLTDGLANAKGPGMPMWGWQALEDTQNWLRGVVWPGHAPDLDRALINFQCVVDDFMKVVADGQPHAQNRGRWLKLAAPRHPYTEAEWERFVATRDLVIDLILEATRAANYVCDIARAQVDSVFRLTDGRLGVTFMSDWRRFPIYEDGDLADLYPGLRRFKDMRAHRREV